MMRCALAVVLVASLGCSGVVSVGSTGALGSSGSSVQVTGATGTSGSAGSAGASSSSTTGTSGTSSTSTPGSSSTSTSTSTSSGGSSGGCCPSLGCENLGETCDATLCVCRAVASTSTSTGGSGSTSGTVCTNAGCAVYASTDHSLYQVNPSTLAETQLCSFGGQLTGSSADNVTDIAVASNGTLYAITETALYTVGLPNGSTCAATKVTSLSTNNTRFVCLAFTAGDTLLAADEQGNVYTIQASNGTVTKVGAFGGTLSCSGDIVAINDANQTIYASAADSSCSASHCTDKLVTLSPPNYAATVIGDLGYPQVYGLGYWAGTLYGFTYAGKTLQIDPTSGASTLINTVSGATFSGGATTPLAPVVTH